MKSRPAAHPCLLRITQFFFHNILQGTNTHTLSPTVLRRGYCRASRKNEAGCADVLMKQPRNGKLLLMRTLGVRMFPENQGPEPSTHQTSVCRVALLYPHLSHSTGRYHPGPQTVSFVRPTKHRLEINKNSTKHLTG